MYLDLKHTLRTRHLPILFISLAGLLAGFAGCSSAPKRPPEIFTNRNAAVAQLDLSNRAVSKGDYENAYLFLGEAWRLALGTDDPETRIRVLIAKGNALFNEGKLTEANDTWTEALAEAKEDANKTLISTCKIYIARSSLTEGKSGETIPPEVRQKNALIAKKVAETEMGNIKNNPLYTAFAWKVIGLSEKELGKPREAEEAIRKAAAIHEKACFLEDAAYDWYLVASVRSKAGQYPNAIAALQTALTFDRRAENANGLGMDWMAIGIIQEKAGNADEAAIAYKRSVAIFKSAFLVQNTAEAERRLAALTAISGASDNAQSGQAAPAAPANVPFAGTK